MDCRDVEQRIADEVPLGPEGEAHLASCDACRGLAGGGPILPRALRALVPAPSVRVPERDVRAELDADRGVASSVRSWSRPARMILVAGVIALDALLTATVLLRRDFDSFPRWRLMTIVAVHAAVVLGVMWEAMRPLYRPPRRPGVTAVLLVLGVILPSLFLALPELPTAFPFEHARVGWGCFSTGIVQALALLVLFGLLDRSGGQLRPFLLAAVAGGLLAQIGLSFHCAVNDRLHLFTGHALVPIGLLVGALALRGRPR